MSVVPNQSTYEQVREMEDSMTRRVGAWLLSIAALALPAGCDTEVTIGERDTSAGDMGIDAPLDTSEVPIDTGTTVDALDDVGIDTGADDVGSIADAPMDATDTGVLTADTGPTTDVPCPPPFVVCGECVDPRTNPMFCGASRDCMGSFTGEVCTGLCSAGRCVWDNCSAALAAGHTTDGLYLIDVDGSGPVAPRDAYCDMTTDGGGWTLVYRIRNDVPGISDPWWAQVGLGSGDALPTTRGTLPAGTHFEGAVRDVRAGYFTRHLGPTQGRATVLRASDGTVLFDLVSAPGGLIDFLVHGNGGLPMASTPPGFPDGARVLASASGLPGPGTTGYEIFVTDNDFDYFSIVSPVRIFGDESVGFADARFANSTTLFWLRSVP